MWHPELDCWCYHVTMLPFPVGNGGFPHMWYEQHSDKGGFSGVYLYTPSRVRHGSVTWRLLRHSACTSARTSCTRSCCDLLPLELTGKWTLLQFNNKLKRRRQVNIGMRLKTWNEDVWESPCVVAQLCSAQDSFLNPSNHCFVKTIVLIETILCLIPSPILHFLLHLFR